MDNKDKELEQNDAFRQKLWIESIDMINSNLVNIHSVFTEIEKSVNHIGLKQEQLISLVEFANEVCTSNKEEPREIKRPDMTFPKFSHSLASFDFDPPNIKTSKAYKRRK